MDTDSPVVSARPLPSEHTGGQSLPSAGGTPAGQRLKERPATPYHSIPTSCPGSNPNVSVPHASTTTIANSTLASFLKEHEELQSQLDDSFAHAKAAEGQVDILLKALEEHRHAIEKILKITCKSRSVMFGHRGGMRREVDMGQVADAWDKEFERILRVVTKLQTKNLGN